jgi:Protein of unknown function with PCYCGC motif
MKKRIAKFFLLTIVAGLATLFAANASGPVRNRAQTNDLTVAYHDRPPSTPLPLTLDPALFANNRKAFVSYTLARRIKNLLYQVPCYCPCHKLQGHESLLDCYTGKHGVACPTCQKEVLFCFLQNKKRKSAIQVRKAIAKGKAWKLDLSSLTDSYYWKIQANHE